MIRHRERSNQNGAGMTFLQWADSLFSGNVIVSITVYADESGTHDPTGQKPGSEVPVIAGYMAFRNNWKFLCRDWKAVLDRYNAPYYHAREFENRKRNYQSPYCLWDDDKADSFKYALAEIAGRNVPISGGHNLQEHLKRNPEDESYPYKNTIQIFFTDLVDALKERQRLSEKISVVFDINTGKKWNAAINDEVNLWKKNGLKIGSPAYGDDKEILPLQAADMISHRSRILHFEKLQRQAEIHNQTGRHEDVRVTPTVFDIMLNRNLHPKTGLNPVVTDELSKEIAELVKKHSSVRRTLMEIPNNPFKLHVKRTKRN